MLLKPQSLRDRDYLTWLREHSCIISGQYGTVYDAIDPAHIGTNGKGLKADDCHVLPVLHSIHQQMHQVGEITFLRENLPADVLRHMCRLYGEKLYADYKAEQWL